MSTDTMYELISADDHVDVDHEQIKSFLAMKVSRRP
jgi:hypothetical protein